MDREDNEVKLNLRLDERLHQRLADEAKRSLRSLNSEIRWRLQASLDERQSDTATA